MEEMMPITHINDFLFCPRSLYFGNVFRASRGEESFQRTPQKEGKAAHRTVDENTYSTRKNILSGIMVHCSELRVSGRIDLYDVETGVLTERKNSVSAVWEGFRMQLYAQYLALREAGHEPKALRLHSLKDNKTHPVELPREEDVRRLKQILAGMRSFRLEDAFAQNERKCANCIYNGLCDVYAKGGDE